MNQKALKVSLWRLCYFSGLVLWIIATIISSSELELGIIWNILVRVSMGLAIMSVALRRVFKKSSLRSVLLVLAMFFFVLSTYTSYRMLHTFVFMICAIDLDFDEVLRVHAKAVGTVTAFVVVLSLLGIINNVNTMRHLKAVRYLGFTAPLAPILFCFVVLTFVAYKREDIRLSHIIAISAINIWLFVESQVNAPFFTVFLILLCAILLKKWNRLRNYQLSRKMKIALIILPLVAFAFSVIISSIYTPNNPIMQAINVLVNGRWQLQKTAIETYGLKLFGNNIQWEQSFAWGTEYLYVDSAFLKYALMNGLGFMALFVTYLIIVMKRICDDNNKFYLIVFTVIVIYGIFNPQLLYLEYNPFLLFPVFVIKDKVDMA